MKRKYHEDQEMSDMMVEIFMRALEGTSSNAIFAYERNLVSNAWLIAEEAVKMLEKKAMGFHPADASPNRLLT